MGQDAREIREKKVERRRHSHEKSTTSHRGPAPLQRGTFTNLYEAKHARGRSKHLRQPVERARGLTGRRLAFSIDRGQWISRPSVR